jgi:hypothetical protein
MEAIEFIKEKLTAFIKIFTKTKVSYEYFEQSDTHFIEVLPNNIYYLDDNYIKWEADFFDLFISKYPDQNICFISDDALVGLDNIHFELTGRDYSPQLISTNTSVYTISENSIKFNPFAQISIISPINSKIEKINVAIFLPENFRNENFTNEHLSLSESEDRFSMAA